MPHPHKMRRRPRPLTESAAPVLDRPTAGRVVLTETRTQPAATGATQLVQLIDAGWGSSGYYSPQVLEAAARDRVLPAGTHMYLDHPTAQQEINQPERSVRDLAAVLAEDAHYDPQRQGLVARVRVMPHCREVLAALAEHIGVSIRAEGMAETGNVEGRTGPIVTRITGAQSVDYVTRAGRGGKVLELLEAARATNLQEDRNVGAWLESRLHLELTRIADDMYGDGCLTRDERIVLSSAIGDGLAAWSARVEADAPQLFLRDPYTTPEHPVAVVEDGQPDTNVPATVPADTGITEAAPAADDNPPHEEEPAMSGTASAGTASVAESALSPEARAQIAETSLRESAARITALEAQNASLTVERDTARGEVRRIRNVETARGAVTSALDAVQDLPAPARHRITESVTANPPVTTSGDVDAAALQTAVTAMVESEQAYIASIREAAGVGTPTGLGGDARPVGDVGAWHTDIQSRFARLGLSEGAASAAARR
jgi:hypothetical protein